MSYYSSKDHWQVRALEWTLFALAWSFRQITWPIGTWRLTGALAPFGGWLALRVPGFSRRAADNLNHVWPELPPERHREIIAGAGREMLALMVEYSRLDKMLDEVAIEIDGETVLRHRPAGKGAILVTAHFGNWEAARFGARQIGHECGIIYRAFNNRYLDRFTLGLIPKAGTPVLQKGTGMRQLYAHIAKGGVAMILVDQRNSGAPFIDFLGEPAETVTAAAELSLRTGAPLIPCVAYRDRAAQRFRVHFEQPVTGVDAEEMMAEVNARIAGWIARAPEQWFWFHRRWRRTPRSRPSADQA
ncbi:MAG: lysophospholipid acyltransferase family protein [Pseudomonadota bacterium]